MLVGIDTNILLRMIVNDDPAQQKLAINFGSSLGAEDRGFVSLMVLVELAWSLATYYRQPKSQVVAAIRTLLRIRTLSFESQDAVVRALERADHGADFADALIAEHNLQQGCVHTVTFDKKAASRLPSMELLS
jgi:predicted nucleic-acid-binding protein